MSKKRATWSNSRTHKIESVYTQRDTRIDFILRNVMCETWGEGGRLRASGVNWKALRTCAHTNSVTAIKAFSIAIGMCFFSFVFFSSFIQIFFYSFIFSDVPSCFTLQEREISGLARLVRCGILLFKATRTEAFDRLVKCILERIQKVWTFWRHHQRATVKGVQRPLVYISLLPQDSCQSTTCIQLCNKLVQLSASGCWLLEIGSPVGVCHYRTFLRCNVVM